MTEEFNAFIAIVHGKERLIVIGISLATVENESTHNTTGGTGARAN